MSTGLRSGLLMALVGAFLVMRTITQDHTGRTLVDRLLGRAGGGDTSPGGNADPTGNRSEATQKAIGAVGQPSDAKIKKHIATHPANPLAGLIPFAPAVPR